VDEEVDDDEIEVEDWLNKGITRRSFEKNL
jgi:hypothetical protein